jgi:TetR/AcrR family transcriptional repressor of nem operon
MAIEKPSRRTEQKEQTHRRIVAAAAHQFRKEGLGGAGVQRIMEEAGLTHGGFYTHFDSKADLAAEAVALAMKTAHEGWLEGAERLHGPGGTRRMLDAYLNRAHRDNPGAGCPLPSTSADVARAAPVVRRAYATELRKIIESLERHLVDPEDDEAHERAVGALALCVGGLLLARAVDDGALSDDILRACRQFGADLTDDGEKR